MSISFNFAAAIKLKILKAVKIFRPSGSVVRGWGGAGRGRGHGQPGLQGARGTIALRKLVQVNRERILSLTWGLCFGNVILARQRINKAMSPSGWSVRDCRQLSIFTQLSLELSTTFRKRFQFSYYWEILCWKCDLVLSHIIYWDTMIKDNWNRDRVNSKYSVWLAKIHKTALSK